VKLTRPRFLSSPIVTVKIASSRTYYLHSALLITESERFSKDLSGSFREAEEKSLIIEHEDPEMFGFFVEYLYRDRSVLSKQVSHYSQYVTLARLYAMGERLMATKLQAYCMWRFSESLSAQTSIPDEIICDLLQIACCEITERAEDDALRSQILWYGANKLVNLQKLDMFREILLDIPDLGQQLCEWVSQSQPPKPVKPTDLLYKKFKPESEYALQKDGNTITTVDIKSDRSDAV
jgi:hypothetical protein